MLDQIKLVKVPYLMTQRTYRKRNPNVRTKYLLINIKLFCMFDNICFLIGVIEKHPEKKKMRKPLSYITCNLYPLTWTVSGVEPTHCSCEWCKLQYI